MSVNKLTNSCDIGKAFFFLMKQLQISNKIPHDPKYLWYKAVSRDKGEGSSQVAWPQVDFLSELRASFR